MTKEITQEERLDLTTDKIKAEKLAYSIELFKSLEAIRKGKEIFICDLKAENQRLKEQLDREIKINRIMKKALEKYADLRNWRCDTITGFQSVWQGGVDDEQTGNITALQVLKEIDNKE